MTPSDSELRDRLAGPAGDWVAAAGAAAGSHLDVEELIEYHAGLLSEDEERRIQDHLSVCRDCLANLLELDSFTAPREPDAPEAAETGGTRTGSPGALDFETAAAWRSLRPRLPAAPARPSRWAGVLAAVLALAVIGLTLYSLDRRREAVELGERLAATLRPEPAAAIVDLYPPSEVRGGTGGEPAAELPAETGYATLIVNLPDGEPSDRYEIEIRDSRNRLLWSGGGLEASRLGTLRLGLPAGFLPPGDHALEVFADDGGERLPIETYAIRVHAR